MPSRRELVLDSSTVANGSASDVMRLVRSPATWPRWQPEILTTSGPDVAGEGALVHGEAELLGFHVDGRSDVTRSTERFFEEDVVVGVRMRIVYEVEQTGDGTRVTRRLIAHLPAGLAGRVLSFFLARRLRKMQAAVLANLARYAAPSEEG